MKKKLIYGIALTSLFFSCQNKPTQMDNPLLTNYTTPYQVPPFDIIQNEHYIPAFEAAINQQNSNIETIVNNTATPSFENTIEALENSAPLMQNVSSVFFNLLSANTNNQMIELSQTIVPMLTAHSDNILLNAPLFDKVKAVYQKRDQLNLTVEQTTLLKNTYDSFTRGGANLADDKKEEFREINKQLSLLYLKFGDNLLNETNRFKLIVNNVDELEGLSENDILSASLAAEKTGYTGKYLFTIHKPSLLPVLENAKNRELRRKMFNAYIMKGDNNDSLDNKNTINQIVNLRLKKANLLGFNSFAEYVLDVNMAKTPANVYDLLDKLMPSALELAKTEVADMQKMVVNEGNSFKIEPHDYAYYATKVKEQKFSLNENEIKPYLKLDNVRDGMFWVANKLYGINFEKLDKMPVYFHDVEVYKVTEPDGILTGILYLDYFPRESKRSGAWCTSYRSQKYENGNRVAPVMSVVCNFSAPVGNSPALLSVDETETLFHEFGHALDGLFSNKNYESLSVPRDFVELPSQIMENWAFAPEVLKHYAKHYQTGEQMPDRLIEKIQNAGKFNQGFATTEYLAASYLDMDWHTINQPVDFNVNQFEKQSMEKINLINEIVPRYRSTYFQHIFSSEGYASGYYSYIWAEVLDADAFEYFMQKGLFDAQTASSFRKNVLELGGTRDAMELYVNFRGQKPDIDALKHKRGLN